MACPLVCGGGVSCYPAHCQADAVPRELFPPGTAPLALETGTGQEGLAAHGVFSLCRRHSRTRASVRALAADLPKQVSPSIRSVHGVHPLHPCRTAGQCCSEPERVLSFAQRVSPGAVRAGAVEARRALCTDVPSGHVCAGCACGRGCCRATDSLVLEEL